MELPLNENGHTATRIFNKGAVKFGAFKLKLHEKNPDAPLSPFFFHLRDKNNPKPGPLDESDYDLIAQSILKAIKDSGVEFDAIAGIPNAGDPIVEAIERIAKDDPEWSQLRFRIIKLSKIEEDGKRKIVPLPGFEYRKGERVLLADDLITQADTKLEAISAVESSGSIVVGVVVLIDRQQGGKEQLEKAGYKLYAAFTISKLFEFYRSRDMISEEKYNEAVAYVAANRL